MDSVLVDISGAIAMLVTKTSDSADIFVLLTEVSLVAISIAATATVSTNGASVTIRKAVSGADRATVAGETNVATSV